MITSKQILEYKTNKDSIQLHRERSEFLNEYNFVCSKSYYGTTKYEKNKKKFNSEIKDIYLCDALIGMCHKETIIPDHQISADVKNYFSFCFSHNEKKAFEEGLEILKNNLSKEDFNVFFEEIIEKIISNIKYKSELFNTDTCIAYFSTEDILWFSEQINKYPEIEKSSVKKLDFIMKLFIADPEKQREVINPLLKNTLRNNEWFILEYLFHKHNERIFVPSYEKIPFNDWKIEYAQIKELLCDSNKGIYGLFFNPLLILENQVEFFSKKNDKNSLKQILNNYETYPKSYDQPIIKKSIKYLLNEDGSPGKYLEYFESLTIRRNKSINDREIYDYRKRQERIIKVIEQMIDKQNSLKKVLIEKYPKSLNILNVIELINFPFINNKYSFGNSYQIEKNKNKLEELNLSEEQKNILYSKYDGILEINSKISDYEIPMYESIFGNFSKKTKSLEKFIAEKTQHFESLYKFNNTINWFGKNTEDNKNQSYYYKKYTEKFELLNLVEENNKNTPNEKSKTNFRF